MPTPRQQEAVAAFKETGSVVETARRLGIGERQAHYLLRDSGMSVEERRRIALEALPRDPAIQEGMDRLGAKTPPDHGWIMSGPDEDGNRVSFHFKVPSGSPTLAEQMAEVWEQLSSYTAPQFEPRPPPTGKNLLVMDLSDVHVGKLATKSETGQDYNADIAVHRMREGARALMRKSAPHGVGHILLVIGNDILHVDTSKSTTTSGTFQDSSTTLFEMYRAAKFGLTGLIEEIAEVAKVDLMFVPSNHDWISGWMLAQDIASWFRHHPNVRATEYNMSERHRKYFRFGKNLIGQTHGDGAKEADLQALMMKEAREHISECEFLYWYLHHYHHKIRKTVGMDKRMREKDLTGMTIIGGGAVDAGDGVQIEYVRSPSPPDSWHDRNGYVNAQAVECFLHDPERGGGDRFTEWF